jgi:hypothetical protein
MTYSVVYQVRTPDSTRMVVRTSENPLHDAPAKAKELLEFGAMSVTVTICEYGGVPFSATFKQ